MHWSFPPRHSRRRLLLGFTVSFALAGQFAHAVTITEKSSTEWDITTDTLSFALNPTNSNISNLEVTLNGVKTNWLDTSYGDSPFGHAVGFYPLNGYSGATKTGATTAGYHLNGYLDMWITKADIPGSDPLEVENHFVVRDGDPGIHFYQVLRHFSGDGATGFGNAAINFFCSSNAITQSDGTTLLYQVNTGPNNIGVEEQTFPTTAYTTGLLASNPGRQVQAETVDYTKSALGNYLSEAGLGREFITKYNYSTYQQYHLAHGYVGANNAFWWVVPSPETMIGGPTKQFLSGIELEYASAHLGGSNINFAAGQVANRLLGPFYLHLNAFNSTNTNAASLYNDAVNSIPGCLSFYDSEGILLSNGYRARSNRGTVVAHIAGSKWSTSSSNNLIVLSDNNTYMQESSAGFQYWGYANEGTVTIPDVMPGTYRLTAYSLGTWGLFHIDNVVVSTTTTTVNGTFDERNFSSQAPIWTIGTPDRSAHEFMNGHLSNGFDNRDYLAIGNYWQELESNSGKLVYTIGSSTVDDWPFTQYNTFYPNLYAGVYGGSTSGINGYDYITPAYVISGAKTEGKTPAQFSPPAWEIHFTTTAAQMAQGGYVLVSINLAANDTSSLQLRLNGKHKGSLLWYPRLGSDPEERSGVAGYNNYAVFQFNTADLLPAGQTNVLTLFASGACMYDALKLEIGSQPADPSISGWPEYDWNYYNSSDASTTQAAASP